MNGPKLIMGRNFFLGCKFLVIAAFILLIILPVCAQVPLRGLIIDRQSRKPIPGASIHCRVNTEGTSSDSQGQFMVYVDSSVKELEVKAMGYKPKVVLINNPTESLLTILLKKEDRDIEAVEINQKIKYNRANPAVEIIDLVIQHKKSNKLIKKDSLFFKQYEKVKFGLVNPERGFSTRLGDMSFFFQNVDTSSISGKGVVSLYMQEGISENYVKQHPSRTKKVIIAEKKTEFDPRYINNHNIESYLNYILQPVDIYDESVFFVNKLFLSPIADNAKIFYKYFLIDTIGTAADRAYLIRFEPFNKADLLFSGELIISMDGRYAVQQANLSVDRQANLSWITSLNFNLSYFKNKEGIMLQRKSHVTAQFGRKTSDILFGELVTINEDYDLNYPFTSQTFEGAPIERKIDKGLVFNTIRPVPLNISEQFTYYNVDQINQLKSFRTLAAVGYLLSQGYYSFGKFEMGPLEYLYHNNNIEGARFRVGGRTTAAFSERVFLQGYLAYGLKDSELKYFLRGAVSLNGKSVAQFPAHYVEGTIQHDVFDPGKSIGFLKGDSFFRSFGGNRPQKWLDTYAYRIGHLIEFGNHVSVSTGFTHQRRSPLGDLKFISSADSSVLLNQINTNDLQVVLRWAPFEKFYYRNLERTTIVENHPVFKIQYNKGLKGFWGANYEYDALRFAASKRFFMNQIGFGDVTFSTGKIWGTLPYPLLEIPNVEGVQDRFSISYERTKTLEFVADEFVKVSYDHQFDGFFLNKIPLIKKLKLREIVGVKMFYGKLSDRNNPQKSDDVILFDRGNDGHVMTNVLGNNPYWEGYIGLQNIFKILQVQYYKRLNYVSFPNARSDSFWNNLVISLRIDF